MGSSHFSHFLIGLLICDFMEENLIAYIAFIFVWSWNIVMDNHIVIFLFYPGIWFHIRLLDMNPKFCSSLSIRYKSKFYLSLFVWCKSKILFVSISWIWIKILFVFIYWIWIQIMSSFIYWIWIQILFLLFLLLLWFCVLFYLYSIFLF